MNLHVFTATEEEFDASEFSHVYVLESCAAAVAAFGDSASITIVTAKDSGLDEDVLDSVSDVVETDDPHRYILSRVMPGDVALLGWDESEEAYETLRILNRSGVTVLDPADEFVEVVLDKSIDLEDLVDIITRRVTTDVLQTLREEMDSPGRRSKFRSRPPRA
jgi:hypothetical protein